MSKGHTLQDPYLNALRNRADSGIYLPRQWHQAAGSS